MTGFIELDYDCSEGTKALINVNHIVFVKPIRKTQCEIVLSAPYADEYGNKRYTFFYRSYKTVKNKIAEALGETVLVDCTCTSEGNGIAIGQYTGDLVIQRSQN